MTTVPFGVTGSYADVGFTEFENNVCPLYCPTPGNESCEAAHYVIVCDENFNGTYIEPTTFTATVSSILPPTDPPSYTVHFASTNAYTLGDEPGNKIFQCKVEGTLNPGSPGSSIAYSNDFSVEFSPCSSPIESCFANTWDSLVTDNLSWSPPVPVGFEIFKVSEPIEFSYETWKDWFSLYCGTNICGPLVFNWELVDDEVPINSMIPLEIISSLDSGTALILTLTSNDFEQVGNY